jgi:hypothetical protein
VTRVMPWIQVFPDLVAFTSFSILLFRGLSEALGEMGYYPQEFLKHLILLSGSAVQEDMLFQMGRTRTIRQTPE